MRMQNTDMEFVTFDAQDVIATSWQSEVDGSPSQIFMTGQVAVGYNEEYGLKGTKTGFNFVNENNSTIGEKAYTYFFAYGTSAYPTEQPSSKWQADARSTSAETFTNAGYIQLEGVDDVYNWLKTHGYSWQ